MPAQALRARRAAFRDELIRSRYLVPLGSGGLYALAGAFEDIVTGIGVRVTEEGRRAHGDRAAVLRFPPVFPAEDFDRTDYIAAFPHLSGLVNTFGGGEEQHRELLLDREAGLAWDSHLAPSGIALVSAACHPCYAGLAGALPEQGALLDVYGSCFRREPAADPARMQSFRMREFVAVGRAEQAAAHQASWIPRAQGVLSDLGLDAATAPASDPFFGRTGRMLAAHQLAENKKTELVVHLYGADQPPTAVASCNNHTDHFGVNFSISASDGTPAHSACVGFGMERIALGLLKTHGFDRAAWPASAKAWL
ncbi:amino acid--[acyl-carrier-protein] ligase [Segniliparus rugosus]|uniref:Amino acid--[acyl-carrier-protein] ligase n=1 Tax=Segniliparus rugosus (strain ATCC BAA-974 / DSM 45345 / CCUG 50838 / CIP 108380 / JCM 13579 / CDC 945) TaxID=679197 RepID=E5XNQ3_SEGRC|nr:amino acid--[acyl-carrier-protein] ligase [Segniliparus rugosus]EFV14043.1 hypothetical protein HMPREF9336_01124 [Segniliparus rugosus ATCC BAA-974]